jgi:YggT family protein
VNLGEAPQRRSSARQGGVSPAAGNIPPTSGVLLNTMRTLLLAFLQIYLVVLIARAVLSWFRIRPGTALATLNSGLVTVTEPALAPVRRVIPRAGGFDLSFLVVFFGIVILRVLIANG